MWKFAGLIAGAALAAARTEEDCGHTWLSATPVGLGGQMEVTLSTSCIRGGGKSPALSKPAAARFPGESC